MTQDLRNLILPISDISEPRKRRAIIHSLKDEPSAIEITDVLIYLTLSYLEMLKDHKRLLNANDGFMEKPIRDISFFTGIVTSNGGVDKKHISAYIKCLEALGLIETRKGGAESAKLIKVNLTELENYIVTAERDWGEASEEYLAQRKAQREKAITKIKSNLEKGYNAEHIDDAELAADRLNRLSDTIDFRDIREALTGTAVEPYWSEIWLFSCYYERYTGKPYWWSGLKLEILVSTWKDRPLNERSITAAISKALNPGFNDYPDFERRFRVHYSSYLRDVPEGVIFDNLRNQ